MITIYFVIFLPSFIGLYIQYMNHKHNFRQAFKRYWFLFFVSNILTVLIMYYILKMESYFGTRFFIVYSIISIIINLVVSLVMIKFEKHLRFSLEKSKTVSSKFQSIISKTILLIALLLLGGVIYYQNNFPYLDFDELFFTLIGGIGGTSPDVLKNIFIFLFGFIVILYPLLYLLFFVERYRLYLYYDKKKISLIPFKFFTKKVILRSTYILIFVILIAIITLNLKHFYLQLKTPSMIYEENYVNPESVELKFPKKKKNLIYIIMESMETSVFSLENGGAYDKSIVPELEKIALDNVSFKANESYASGIYVPANCSWTAAAMVCQSSGVNLKFSLSNAGDELSKFLPGAYPLGSILEEEGYNLQILMGSSSSFHNRDRYYSSHGNYNILDLAEAKNQGYIPKNYHEWWGYEDSKLYDISKKELTKISAKDEPFAFTILTADTHFVDGYLDDSCPDVHNNQYLSVYSCASKMLNEFLSWLEKQDFYEDTVVVITGDHLTMQSGIFENNPNDRYIYNTIINSKVKPVSQLKQATSFDVFPTILASMGVEIEGERLGLGTNLFSNKLTLMEELGYDTFTKEISLMSIYYNKNILNVPKEEEQ